MALLRRIQPKLPARAAIFSLAMLMLSQACASFPQECRSSAWGMALGTVALGAVVGSVVGTGVGISNTSLPDPATDLYTDYESFNRPFRRGFGAGAAVGIVASPLGAMLGRNRCIGGRQAFEDLPMPLPATSRKQVIEQHFGGRELDPVEGVWLESTNAYEIAIVKNDSELYRDYTYLGIVVGTNKPTWKVGEVKALIRKTSSKANLVGMYYTGGKEEVGAEFLLVNEVELHIAIGMDRDKQPFVFYRVFPDLD